MRGLGSHLIPQVAAEHLRYVAWVRSSFSFVVDALSGERLDIIQQCVKLRVDGATPVLDEQPQRDPFDLVLEEVSSPNLSKPVLVTGEAASGKYFDEDRTCDPSHGKLLHVT